MGGNTEANWPCDRCEFIAKACSTLKAHMIKHTKEKPYKCTFCSYTTGHQGALHKHVRHHTGDQPYKCKLCSFSASYPSLLRYHMRTHTGEKPFHCSQCGFKSAHLGSLHAHLKIHDGVRSHKCEHCDFAAAYPSGLKQHYAKCSAKPADKTFNCDLCSFSASYPSLLRCHMRIHSVAKPFHCTECNFQSAHPGSLQKHMTLHNRLRPHKCENCNFSTADPSTLKRHVTICIEISTPHQSTIGNETRKRESKLQHDVSMKREKTTPTNSDLVTSIEHTDFIVKCEPKEADPSMLNPPENLTGMVSDSNTVSRGLLSESCSQYSGSNSVASSLTFNVSSMDCKQPDEDIKIYVCSKCNYCTLLHSDLTLHKTAAHSDL